MSIFLCQNERYQAALETCDPLRGTWLLDFLDPLPAKSSTASPPWLRVTGFVLVLLLPIVAFSAVPSSLWGGKLFGRGSLTTDIGLFSVLLFLVISAALLPIGRRLVGDLINELLRQKIVDRGILNFDPRTAPCGKVLRFLEWLSRVDGFRGVVWFVLMLADQVWAYFAVILKDANPMWHSAVRAPGSFLSLLSVGERQPNLAGLWTFVVWGPCILYLMIVIGRLLVVYACLCAHIAANESLRIVPYHPDGAGGLKPIGLTALFLSLFTFALGVDLAGLTIGEFVINRIFRAADQPATTNLSLLFVLWILYFVIGTALFILPLIPLRRRMAAAKRAYLLSVSHLLATAARAHEGDLAKNTFRPDALQGLGALDGLYRTASDMAVWPFDAATFARYGGLLVSPLLPVIADRMPLIVAVIKRHLGL